MNLGGSGGDDDIARNGCIENDFTSAGGEASSEARTAREANDLACGGDVALHHALDAQPLRASSNIATHAAGDFDGLGEADDVTANLADDFHRGGEDDEVAVDDPLDADFLGGNDKVGLDHLARTKRVHFDVDLDNGRFRACRQGDD